MKRKVIQIAGSTQLVSLPRQWAKAHNIQRGQEIEVLADGDKIVISANNTPPLEQAEVDISTLGDMVPRFIHALYKRGVDEVKVVFNDPNSIVTVQNAIGNEVVGFEILEQGKNYCIIRYVSGTLEEFDSILRRTFLLLLSMAEQSYEYLKTSNFRELKNTAFLEEANNRFTTICRRNLNKNGSATYSKIGPIYYIVEELEKLADQYKYICQHFYNLNDKSIKLNADALNMFEKANSMLRIFYEVFYKFNTDQLVLIKELRTAVTESVHKMFQKHLSYADYWLLHHSIVIANMVFCLVEPYIILATDNLNFKNKT